MTNGDAGSKLLGGEILRSIAKTYGWPQGLEERQLIEESPRFAKNFREFVGNYQLDPETQIAISIRDSHLYAQVKRW